MWRKRIITVELGIFAVCLILGIILIISGLFLDDNLRILIVSIGLIIAIIGASASFVFSQIIDSKNQKKVEQKLQSIDKDLSKIVFISDEVVLKNIEYRNKMFVFKITNDMFLFFRIRQDFRITYIHQIPLHSFNELKIKSRGANTEYQFYFDNFEVPFIFLVPIPYNKFIKYRVHNEFIEDLEKKVNKTFEKSKDILD